MSFLNIGQKLEKVMGKEQELLDAARTGNVSAIDKLLSNKPRKSTAVGGGFGHKLSSFLKCNVNCTDKGGFTPLHHAAVNGHRDVVEKLLKYEAQPGSVDNKGCSPVHLAAWNGNPEIVMQLLTAGTDAEPGGASPVTPVHVNQQNGNGDTALHSAAQYGHVAVVDVLLQKHANPTIRNLDEATPLDLAAQYGRLEVVQLLLIKHPELAHRPQGTQSPLHLASGNGHRDIVEVLLNNNFDLHTTTESGTSLHEAALHGKLDVVRILLDWGIDVSARDQKGQTVLELLSAHQTQHKSFTLITQAIKDHMAKLASNQSESATFDSMSSGLYDSLTNCRSGHGDKPTAAVKPMPPDKSLMSDKPVMETLKNPTPAIQSSIIQLSPDNFLDETTPMYAKPHKDVTESDDRVVSSISSVGDLAPPPLPPRSSIFQDKPLVPHKVMETVSPDRSTTGTTAKVNMCVPKKPPRQKKSPAPVRRSSDSTAPDSPPGITISTPPTAKPVNNIPDNTRNIPDVDIVISDNDDCVTFSQHSFKYSSTPTDQLNTKGEELDLSAMSKSHSSNIGSPISPKPALPPRTNVPASKVDNSIDPQTGLQVHQDVYEVMKPVKQVEPIKPVEDLNKHTETDASLKPAEIKIDNYGILFPNFKNSSPEKSQKSKKHEFKRTNTAPEESVYVGHHPISPVSSFKDRQAKLTRANTAPEETSLYTSMTGSIEDIPQTKKEPMKENEYAEIAEKFPTSPKENIYATITDTKKELESQTSVYSQISDLTPPVSPDGRGDNSEVKLAESKTAGNDEEVTVVADESKTSYTEQDCNTKGSIKPNYLDFIKRKSTAPLTPTGYPQPPTPDFPPPSPATAMMGIELKIQEMDVEAT